MTAGVAKDRLFARPPFLTESAPRPRPNTIAIKESPTGGIGVFAERDIKYRELLIAERPLLMTAAFTKDKICDADSVHDYTYEDRIKIMWFEEEQELEMVFNRKVFQHLINSLGHRLRKFSNCLICSVRFRVYLYINLNLLFNHVFFRNF